MTTQSVPLVSTVIDLQDWVERRVGESAACSLELSLLDTTSKSTTFGCVLTDLSRTDYLYPLVEAICGSVALIAFGLEWPFRLLELKVVLPTSTDISIGAAKVEGTLFSHRGHEVRTQAMVRDLTGRVYATAVSRYLRVPKAISEQVVRQRRDVRL